MRKFVKKRFGKAALVVVVMVMMLACAGCGAEANSGVETDNGAQAESVVTPVPTEQPVVEEESETAVKETAPAKAEAVQESSEKERTPEPATEQQAEGIAASTEKEQDIHKEVGEESAKKQEVTELSEAEVLAIAEGGFKALQELNATEMMEYTNIDMFYYYANGEYVDGQELQDKLEAIMSDTDLESGYNNLGVIGWFALLKNVEFYDVQLFDAEKVQELNDFINSEEGAFLGTEGDFEYTIEKAYKVKVSYDGVEEEIMESENEPYVLVIYARDEWKLDVLVSIMKEMYDSLSNLYSEAGMS